MEKEAGKGKLGDEAWVATRFGKVNTAVQEDMEKRLQAFGDEGVLTFLSALDGAGEDAVVQPLFSSSAALARDLMDRRLFRMTDQVGAGDVSPKHVHERYGNPFERARLEAEAQEFAGLGTEPKVLLWIPSHEMRLKLAEVLVQQEAGIAPFVNYERSRSRRGSDIYDAHERLWAAYIFVHRDVEPAQEKMVAAFLGSRMGIRWRRHSYFGGRPDQWPLRLAVAKVFRKSFKAPVEKELNRREGQLANLAARGPKGVRTFDELCREVEASGRVP
ncbi:MAG TPA: hypothetical protein VF093_01795 [Solirubrobacterales bacterium]